MSRLVVSTSPHIRSGRTTRGIMLDVIISMLPTAVAGCIIFGWRALFVIVACVLSAVLSEFLFNVITKREQTVGDLSSVVTGMILGLSIHANSPIWQCVIGSVFAIIVVKCLFGGLGCNFANPAVTARVMLLVAFSATLGGGALPRLSGFENPGITTGATPLAEYASGNTLPGFLDLFLGVHGGAIGETCFLAIMIGFVYLCVRRVINPEVPLVFIGTVFLLSLIFSGSAMSALFQIMAGGLAFGAVFMATDYVTTPITRAGKIVFAFGCGLITSLVRFFGSYPEGVSFAILFMNILSPYIEKWTAKRPLGKEAKK